MEFDLSVKTWMNTDEVKKRVEAASIGIFAKCALLIEADAKRRLSKGGKRLGSAKLGDKKVPVKYEAGPAGEAPRLRTGNLRASIKSAKTERGTYLVGPTVTAFYGQIHEYGGKIRVTPRMRGYLAAVHGIHLKKDTSHITIPKRPFMGPAMLAMAAKFPALFKDVPLGGNVPERDS